MSVSGASLGERLIVPAVVWFLVAAMSGLFMYGSGGSTTRMKVVFRYSMLFTGGLFYSIAWKDVLARILGWEGAWMVAALGFGILSFWRCRIYFREHPNGEALH
jgi:hypothetical protein